MQRASLLTRQADYDAHTINMKFSDNLKDDRERGYILSAAFFSFCAAQGLDKQAVIEMVSSHYDQFTGDNDSSGDYKK